MAVIPTYNPGIELEQLVQTLSAQVDFTLIIDDGSTNSGVRRLLTDLESPLVGCVLLAHNNGIAHALNEAFEQVRRRMPSHFILTLDQDSVITAGYVDDLFRAVNLLEATSRHYLGVGPATMNHRPFAVHAPLGAADIMSNSGLQANLEMIQSGLLVNPRALENDRPFDESFVIDCVDVDFILRAARKGNYTFHALGVDLGHALGRELIVRVPARRRALRVGYHGPLRYYYIARNRVTLVRRFAFAYPGWALRTSMSELKIYFLCLFAGPDKLKLALAAATGVLHGLVQRSGVIPAGLARMLRTSS